VSYSVSKSDEFYRGDHISDLAVNLPRQTPNRAQSNINIESESLREAKLNTSKRHVTFSCVTLQHEKDKME